MNEKDYNKRINSLEHLIYALEDSYNRFLTTRKGLLYLLRYPNLSVQDAIKEYKLSSRNRDKISISLLSYKLNN